jgi:translation elongation factor EF-4
LNVTIQAAVNSRVLSREDLKAYRKDVTAKCYGGDIRRKMKLLANQAEGKKRLRSIGKIEIEKDTFIKLLTRKPSK